VLLLKITVEDVERFKQERSKEVSQSTVNHDLTLFKHTLRLAIQWGYLEVSPARFVEKFELNNERTKFLSHQDFDKIVDNCTPELAFVVKIAVHTGMRLGELTKLDWNDIDLVNRFIMVLDTKNQESRNIPINEKLYPLLEGVADKTGTVITTSEKRIRSGFEAAVKKAGIDRGEGLNRLVFHSLRHTCGSWLAMKGASTLAIAAVLGHKSLAMTKRYSKFAKGSLASVMELLAQD
jgi:integrase